MIKVGRSIWNKNKDYKHPNIPNYTPIVVLTKSSEYGELGPYVLKNKDNQIMENIWQASKVYKETPTVEIPFSQKYKKIVWVWNREIHTDQFNNPNDKYWIWRDALMNNSDAVRYPVGIAARHSCLYSLHPDINKNNYTPDAQLNYIDARKKIYLPIYTDLVKRCPQFRKLKHKLNQGENLLILEVDGPHYESLKDYKEKYSVHDFINSDNTIDANLENLKILINDTIHPFGHGYCLAAELLGLTEYLQQ